MAPHSNGTVNTTTKQSAHRRAKSSRVAPAIPYSLVKPKPTPKQSALELPTHPKGSEPTLSSPRMTRPETVQRPESTSHDAPETPISVSSSQSKTAVGLDTPAESLFDRINGTDHKRTGSATTSPPTTHATVSPPKSASGSFSSGPPTVTMPGPPAFLNGSSDAAKPNGDTAAQRVHAPNGSSRGHQHQTSRPVNGHNHVLSNGEPIAPAYIFSTAPNTTAMIPPPGLMSQQHNGFTSPSSLASPTSGWNPNANFVPPSHQYQRPVYDSMSERAVSHTSSTQDARSGMPPMGTATSVQSLPPADGFNWSRYISNFYSDSSFADFSLRITREKSHTFPEFPAHGIVLARSPILQNLMRNLPANSKRNEAGTKYITLDINERLTSYSAVLEAVGYLYGLPLANFSDGVIPNAPFSVVMDRMTSALALAGAGHRLGLPEVMGHGLAFASNFISWPTFEKALAFAHASMAAAHGFEAQDSRSQEFTGICIHYTSNLMFSLERFIVANFPAGFEFSSSAPELTEARRLPKVVETRNSVHNPLLDSIQFGNMPSDADNLEVDVLLSSILLSVPSQFLGHMLDSPDLATKLGASALVTLMRAVVEERESRRASVGKARKREGWATHQQIMELKWNETVAEYPQAPLGYMIARAPVDTSSTPVT